MGDRTLQVLEWASKRGGCRQRLSASSQLRKYQQELELGRQLREASQFGDKVRVEELLVQIPKACPDHDGGPDTVAFTRRVLNDTTLHDDHTALWHAVASGHYEIATYLLHAGASPDIGQDNVQTQAAREVAKLQLQQVGVREKRHWKGVIALMERAGKM